MSNASWYAADGVARLLCPAPHVIHLVECRVLLLAGMWEEHVPLPRRVTSALHKKTGHNFPKEKKIHAPELCMHIPAC